MESVFCLEEQQTGWEVRIARAVLTLFAQGHASHEGIQHCIEEMLGEHVRLSTISASIYEAG